MQGGTCTGRSWTLDSLLAIRRWAGQWTKLPAGPGCGGLLEGRGSEGGGGGRAGGGGLRQGPGVQKLKSLTGPPWGPRTESLKFLHSF